MKNIHFLLTITRREDSEAFVDFFNSRDLSCIYSAVAEGTARQKTLALLGLERSYKSIHCAVVPGSRTTEILRDLSTEMQIDLPDRGVAIAVPILSVSGSRTLQYLLSGTELSAVEGEPMQSDYELIIAILEAGYTDMVMDAAREGGAGGGTVVHGKTESRPTGTISAPPTPCKRRASTPRRTPSRFPSPSPPPQASSSLMRTIRFRRENYKNSALLREWTVPKEDILWQKYSTS